MKKIIKICQVILTLFMVLAFSSCSFNAKKTPTDKTANLNIIYDDNADDIAVFPTDNSFKENGTLYIESTYPSFKMSNKFVKANSTLHHNINEFNKEIKDNATSFVEEYKEYVKAEFKKRDIQAGDGHYKYDSVGTITRKDNKIISIMTKTFVDTMIANPPTVIECRSFDALTGTVLQIENLVADVNLLEKFIIDYLESVNNTNGIKLFDDYKKTVHNLITDTNTEEYLNKFQFYITDKSLNVVFNQYDIAPYRSGNITYKMNYDDYPEFLTKRYFK